LYKLSARSLLFCYAVDPLFACPITSDHIRTSTLITIVRATSPALADDHQKLACKDKQLIPSQIHLVFKSTAMYIVLFHRDTFPPSRSMIQPTRIPSHLARSPRRTLPLPLPLQLRPLAPQLLQQLHLPHAQTRGIQVKLRQQVLDCRCGLG